MADRSNIEWCDSTFNPWIGCTKVSPACDHCYAETLMDTRMGRAEWGAGKPRVRTSAANWRKPVHWNAQPFAGCNECGWRGVPAKGATGYQCGACSHVNLSPQRRRVFCASLADVFDNEAPAEWRAALFALIAQTPNLDWLLLTKRIGNVAKMIEAPGMQKCGLPPNVWLGATICNQDEADRDIPKLLAVPAAVRFVSIEPMLVPINFRWTPYVHQSTGETYREYLERNGKVDHLESLRRIDWVIAGGESGPHARPSHPDWFRSLRDQCAAAGVPFLFKQWGEWAPPDDIEAHEKAHHGWWEDDPRDGGVRRHEWQDHESPCLRTESFRIGKKAAGRLLDGREHNGFPGGAA